MKDESSNPATAGRDYLAGIVASLVAETLFVLMVAGIAALRDMSPWTVVKIPATFLLGPEAVDPAGFVLRDVVLGIGVHIGASIVVGVLFAWSLPRLRLAPPWGGLLVAGLLYLFGFWILPLLFPRWLSPYRLPPVGRLLQVVAHAFYGAVLGTTYSRLRRDRVRHLS